MLWFFLNVLGLHFFSICHSTGWQWKEIIQNNDFVKNLCPWGLFTLPKLLYETKHPMFQKQRHLFLSFFFSCWLDFSNGLIWAFGAPVACVLVVNSVMFMIAIRIARKSIQKRGQSSERTLALIKGTYSIEQKNSWLSIEGRASQQLYKWKTSIVAVQSCDIMHTTYSWNIKWQKCAGISGLWVLNEIIQKKYPENMKKIVGAVWKLPAK